MRAVTRKMGTRQAVTRRAGTRRTPTTAPAAALLALGLGLGLGLGLTGCGGGTQDSGIATAGGSATASASASGSAGAGTGAGTGAAAALRYSRCMRANGVPDFPDPTTKDGSFQLMLPQGTDQAAVKAADQKCRQYLPSGGTMQKPDPGFLAKMRAYATCMRAHGVPGFPDPNPDGGTVLDQGKIGMAPDDPRFQSADQACASSRPSGTVHSGPGGGSGGPGGGGPAGTGSNG